MNHFSSLDLEMTRLAFGLNVWDETGGRVSKMSGLNKWGWGKKKEQAWVESVGKGVGKYVLFWTCEVRGTCEVYEGRYQTD